MVKRTIDYISNSKKWKDLDKKQVNNVFSNLEQHGRHQYKNNDENKNLTRYLSKQLKPYRERDIVFIGKDTNRRKNMVSIHPDYTLRKISRSKIRIYKNW